METMKMNNNIFSLAILWLALLASGLSSCVDDYFDNYKFDDEDPSGIAEEVAMPFSLTVAPMVAVNPETRAEETYFDATTEEKTIADFWIIEYNEEGTRVGKPRYYKLFETYNHDKVSDGNIAKEWDIDEEKCEISTKNINILVPRNDQEDFTCVVIANTHDENLFNAKNRSKFSTLDSLRLFDFDLHNQQDFFYPVKDDDQQPEKYLLMSGWTKISKDPATWNPSVDLIRNACKVNVKLENFTDELVFKYWQWRNVPWGKLFPHGKPKDNYIQKVSRDWKQHTIDEQENALAEIQNKDGFDFWIPCNVWLPEENYYKPDAQSSNLAETGERATDEFYRQEDPTYFAIGCRGAKPDIPEIGDNTLCEFKLYPAFDPEKYAEVGEFDQFNFEPNHYYSIKADIQKIPFGHPLFQHAEFFELPESNCYMLPIDTKDPYRVPLTQINEFWGGYDESMMLDDDTEWVAEVIWQDTPLRILDFAVVTDDALDARDKFEGKGTENGFAFRTTGTGEGNVIIGVRKKVPEKDIPAPDKREYYWTWHIWITEYNPGVDIPGRELDVSTEEWANNKKSYDVPGGKVQRFYKDCLIESFPYGYLMDRNLGALSADPAPYPEMFGSDGTVSPFATPNEILVRKKTFGLYYQFGRNAPFPTANPAAQPIYNIKGEVIDEFMHWQTELINNHDTAPVVNMVGGEPDPNMDPFVEAVKKPYKFFIRPERRDETECPILWFGDSYEFEDAGLWFSNIGYLDDGRSIFDPCPPGWQVPDETNFARLQYRTDKHFREDPWMPIDNSASILSGRLLGVMWKDSEVVDNAYDESTGFLSGHPDTYIFNTDYVKDESLAIWLTGQGTRAGDQGSCEVFEFYPDYPYWKEDANGNIEGAEPADFGNGLWLNNGSAVKFSSGDIIIPDGLEAESTCSGLAIRCQRMQ
ncbi:MAG: hypothetical protein K2N13_08755 [Paraprevotella sp.]|nr:hypothetical protein [Paraprevotella sp.]